MTIEHQVRPDMLLKVSYVGLRGVHLRQDININPTATGVGTDASRQYQGFLNILEDSHTAMSNYNALQINFQKLARRSEQPRALANYTYSKAIEIALASNGGITDIRPRSVRACRTAIRTRATSRRVQPQGRTARTVLSLPTFGSWRG